MWGRMWACACGSTTTTPQQHNTYIGLSRIGQTRIGLSPIGLCWIGPSRGPSGKQVTSAFSFCVKSMPEKKRWTDVSQKSCLNHATVTSVSGTDFAHGIVCNTRELLQMTRFDLSSSNFHGLQTRELFVELVEKVRQKHGRKQCLAKRMHDVGCTSISSKIHSGGTFQNVEIDCRSSMRTISVCGRQTSD